MGQCRGHAGSTKSAAEFILAARRSLTIGRAFRSVALQLSWVWIACEQITHLVNLGCWHVAKNIPVEMHHAPPATLLCQVLRGAPHQAAAVRHWEMMSCTTLRPWSTTCRETPISGDQFYGPAYNLYSSCYERLNLKLRLIFRRLVSASAAASFQRARVGYRPQLCDAIHYIPQPLSI